jgi:hypothetical protein
MSRKNAFLLGPACHNGTNRPGVRAQWWTPFPFSTGFHPKAKSTGIYCMLGCLGLVSFLNLCADCGWYHARGVVAMVSTILMWPLGPGRGLLLAQKSYFRILTINPLKIMVRVTFLWPDHAQSSFLQRAPRHHDNDAREPPSVAKTIHG